jgi:hypothetical protein
MAAMLRGLLAFGRLGEGSPAPHDPPMNFFEKDTANPMNIPWHPFHVGYHDWRRKND